MAAFRRTTGSPAARRAGIAALAILLLAPGASRAEVELSLYSGLQTAPHSGVSIAGDSVVPDQDFTAGWDGNSFQMPPHYGLRATWWQSATLGFGVEINHVKVYADAETLEKTGFEQFEFSDGLNIITANIVRRWPQPSGRFTPYVGGGLGVAVPHVELTVPGSTTFEYQLTGPAAAIFAGASYRVGDGWSLFAEYKGTYSVNSATLETGGTLDTDIVTNALNLGISFDF